MLNRTRKAAMATALFLAASAAHASTDTVTNPYGLDALWKGGDFIARGTLLILVVMSMGSWYIIVAKLLEQARVLRRAKAAETGFWKAGSLSEGTKNWTPAARSASSPKPVSRHSTITKARWSNRSTSTSGSRRPSSGRPRPSRAACRTASRFSAPSVRPRRSLACSARCGASITR